MAGSPTPSQWNDDDREPRRDDRQPPRDSDEKEPIEKEALAEPRREFDPTSRGDESGEVH